jgi:Kef-type K+ transport system membrane component KefB
MGHGIDATTWAALALMILSAKLGGEIALRLKQPAVLGELLAGIVLGNIPFPMLASAADGAPIAFAAELGVMLLLFQVGLESSVIEMVKVAPRAGAVAVLGVLFPSVLGMGVSRAILPDAPLAAHLFIGATLCATSVGITAAVLKELGALGSEEAKVILGAAVIDDVLGLVLLAIVSAVVVQGAASGLTVARIAGTAIAFVVGSLAIGLWLTRGVYRVAATLRAPQVLGALSVALCLLLAGASATAGLAAIIGAYAAGLLLDEVSVRPFGERGLRHVEEFVAPIVAVFAPVFFVRTGMSVKLAVFDGRSLLLAAALTVVAIVGKLGAGLGVRRGVDRITIGLGMMPRGEVGLIFAATGEKIAIDGKSLLSPAIYAALVGAVFLTTLVAPPSLASRIRSRNLAGGLRVDSSPSESEKENEG